MEQQNYKENQYEKICALVVAALLAGCTAVTTEEISESFRAMAVAGNKDFTCSIEDDVEMTGDGRSGCFFVEGSV